MKKSKGNNEPSTTSLQPGRVAARWSAFLLIVCGGLGYIFSADAYHNPYSVSYATIDFVQQNRGFFFIAAEVLFAYILKRMQAGIYWFSWLQLQTPKPDERQLAVRKRVFERAYAIVVFAIFVLAPGAIVAIAQYANPARNDLILRASWVVGVFFISLPSILAAWQKDS